MKEFNRATSRKITAAMYQSKDNDEANEACRALESHGLAKLNLNSQ